MSEDLPQRISEDTVTGYCQKECQKECEKIWECQKISKNYMQLRRAARQWTYTAYNTKMLALELHDIRLMRLFQSFFLKKKKCIETRRAESGTKKNCIVRRYVRNKTKRENVRRQCQKKCEQICQTKCQKCHHHGRTPLPITGHHRLSQVITGHRLRGCQVRWNISFGRIKSDVFSATIGSLIFLFIWSAI